jgi:anti-sigma factor RsiW
MGPCERNTDRWLDHLYGLLDDQESREVADHLSLCPSCQSSLAEAQRDQRRMARAAGWIREVPEFQLPKETVEPSAPAIPATLPFRKLVRPSLAQRLWPIWVAAAALLLAIFIGAETYRRGAADRDQAVADAKKQIQDMQGRFVALRT